MLWRLGLLLSPSIGLELDLVGNRFVADSPLEEGVYCELVSKSEISSFLIPVRFWAILVS